MSTSAAPESRRRATTLPVLALAALVLPLLSPAVFLAAGLADLATGPRRRRFLRLAALAYTYLAFEVAGIAAAGALWVLSGGGIGLRRPRVVRMHHRLQVWWTTGLLRSMCRLLGTRVDIDGAELAAPGPVVVLGRHASFGDAVLPTVIFGGGHDLRLRHVLKRELAWDPCLDVYGHRLPNHFVDRAPDAGATRELQAIRRLSEGLGAHDAAVIFPEGTFFTPRRHLMAVRRLARRSPELAARAERLRHLLPPRPGGTLALLAGAPDADVVTYAHVGFEPFGSFKAIIANVPFERPILVKLWRHRRDELPTDPDDLSAWLFDRWIELDEWIDAHTAEVTR